MTDLSTRLKTATTPIPSSLFSTLITANHILHANSVVDAYGHISVRNPQNPNTFFISASVAPALVSSAHDLIEYHVSDASPVNPDSPKGYLERFIHSELYKKYAGVNSVVHAHAEVVVPFSITSVPLRPVFHMGGVMGSQVPVYDIEKHYSSSDPRHDLLISSENLGASLAAGFSPTTLIGSTTSAIKNYLTSSSGEGPDFPANPVVLMRGHGFTAVGVSVEEAVYRAVYTCTNARIQMNAVLMQGGFNNSILAENMGRLAEEQGKEGGGSGGKKMKKLDEVKYLSERECKDAWAANKTQASRPWKLWCREVEDRGIYRNEIEEAEAEGEDES